VYDGVAVGPGSIVDEGVAKEGSSSVQVSASPVGINAVEAGCMQEGTSSPATAVSQSREGTRGGKISNLILRYSSCFREVEKFSSVAYTWCNGFT
jgi:hypothetical protein